MNDSDNADWDFYRPQDTDEWEKLWKISPKRAAQPVARGSGTTQQKRIIGHCGPEKRLPIMEFTTGLGRLVFQASLSGGSSTPLRDVLIDPVKALREMIEYADQVLNSGMEDPSDLELLLARWTKFYADGVLFELVPTPNRPAPECTPEEIFRGTTALALVAGMCYTRLILQESEQFAAIGKRAWAATKKSRPAAKNSVWAWLESKHPDWRKKSWKTCLAWACKAGQLGGMSDESFRRKFYEERKKV